jgi:hypothetical protein
MAQRNLRIDYGNNGIEHFDSSIVIPFDGAAKLKAIIAPNCAEAGIQDVDSVVNAVLKYKRFTICGVSKWAYRFVIEG